MRKLLIVDDDPGVLRALKWSLDSYDLVTATDRASAVAAFDQHRPPVVALDMGLPPAVDDASEGLATLDAILAIEPSTKVIMVSGNEVRAHAVAAIDRGAADFYAKPIDENILSLIIKRAFHVFDLEAENRHLKDAQDRSFHGIIASCEAMRDLCRMIEKIARANAAILLNGESGTGKELVARALHRLSRCPDGPFVAINCAAIPENLLESELFGHEKGAFTGADRQVKGKIELADGGTLFLDEIGDMPLALQSKLLRVLQERQIERIGGRRPIAVDVRIVSATHQKLDELIPAGKFREDLYFRLAQISLKIPPLRERGDDIILLARHLIDRFAIEQSKKAPKLTADAATALLQHAWPGNVRELENRIQRAVIFEEGGAITARDLDLAEPGAAAPAEPPAEPLLLTTLHDARKQAERRAVLAAIDRADGNISEVAKLLDVSRPTVYTLMRQHGIQSTS